MLNELQVRQNFYGGDTAITKRCILSKCWTWGWAVGEPLAAMTVSPLELGETSQLGTLGKLPGRVRLRVALQAWIYLRALTWFPVATEVRMQRLKLVSQGSLAFHPQRATGCCLIWLFPIICSHLLENKCARWLAHILPFISSVSHMTTGVSGR